MGDFVVFSLLIIFNIVEERQQVSSDPQMTATVAGAGPR